jgi:hypothetical protein
MEIFMKETTMKDINMEMVKSLTKTEISSILVNGTEIHIMEKGKCGGTQVTKPWKPMMTLMLKLTQEDGSTISITEKEHTTGQIKSKPSEVDCLILKKSFRNIKVLFKHFLLKSKLIKKAIMKKV